MAAKGKPAVDVGAGFTAAHANPVFNLLDEPWIPVLDRSGGTRTVGLMELFVTSHELVDVAEPEPLVRAALRRLLENITAGFLVSVDAVEDATEWIGPYDSNTGFVESGIRGYLESLRDRLWLYHPQHPFMQGLHLATPGAISVSTDDLVPHFPGDSSRAWFYKRSDPTVNAGLDLAEAARGLITYYFYALPSNSGGGHVGGSFSEGPAVVTHLFRVSTTSLFRTLLRNITRALVSGSDGHAVAHGIAWAQDTSVGVDGDALFQASLSGTLTLLGPRREDARVRTVLRGAIPPTGAETTQECKARAAEARDQARENDIHRVVVLSASGKPSTIRVAPGALPYQRLHALLTISTGTKTIRPGVLAASSLWLPLPLQQDEHYEILTAEKAGNPASPQWSEDALAVIDAAHLDPAWSGSSLLADLLTSLFEQKKGMRSRIVSAFSEPLGGGEGRAAIEATAQWYEACQALIDDVLTDPQSMPALIPACRDLAVTAFDTATAPLLRSPRTAPVVADRRRYLTGNLWKDFS